MVKVFNLQCQHAHRFEGWFRSADDFTEQQSHGLVRCPDCDDAAVTRLPTAPYIGRQDNQTGGVSQANSDGSEAGRAKMRQAVRQWISGIENVGERFADEARAIHYQEAPERPIRGKASPAERQSLADEGIDVLPIPYLPGGDGPVQ